MESLDIDLISQGPYTNEDSHFTSSEESQARSFGLSVAVKVRTHMPGQYEIVGSPKSWYLAQAIQEPQVPIIKVDHLSQHDLQDLKKPGSDKLSIIEQANRISDLTIETPNLAKLGRREGLTRSTVCNLVRISQMPETIKWQIDEHPNQVKLGHAKVLAGLSGQQQQSLLDKIIQNSLSVRQAEASSKGIKPSLKVEKDANIISLEDALTGILGCRTTIDVEKGRLNIDYGKNLEILDGVLEHIGYQGG